MAKCYGVNNRIDTGYSIIEVSDGFIVVGTSGSSGCVLKIRNDGTIEWNNTYSLEGFYISFYSVQQISGGYIISGAKCVADEGAGIGNGLILKIDDDQGNIILQKSFGSENRDDAFLSIQNTFDGGYVALGYTDSFGQSIDLWLVKLFSDGYLPSLVFNEQIICEPSFFNSYNTTCSPMDISLIVADTSCNVYNTSAIITQQSP